MRSAPPRFTGQYLLLHSARSSFSKLSWPTYHWGDYALYVAPDQHYHEEKTAWGKVGLIGFAFHAAHPEWSVAEILGRWPKESAAGLDYLDLLCGNFAILIARPDGSLEMYNDASGVMKIFYWRQEGKIPAVATDPALLKYAVPINPDHSERAAAFYESAFFKRTQFRAGDKTAYTDVWQCQPNHSLHLQEATVRRYYPRKPRQALSPEKAAERLHRNLTNVVEAAAQRYQLRCSLTAGWDSRLVLSATLPLREQVRYYTFKKETHSDEDPDLLVPQKMAHELGLPYEVIRVASEMPPHLEARARESYDRFPLQRFDHVINGFGLFDKEQDLALLGAVSEVCKNYYDTAAITDGTSLAKAAHFPVCDYTVDHFQGVYEEFAELEKKLGYPKKDIIHWEQDISTFAAQGMQYNAFAARTFSPFNCRDSIHAVLSIPRRLRDGQTHPFYRMYLKKYHPELLRYPINPSWRRRLMVLGKKTGAYPLYKMIATKLRK